MNIYKSKYLKYKKKYLVLQKGGVIKCPRCTFNNKDGESNCEICNLPLPTKQAEEAGQVEEAGQAERCSITKQISLKQYRITQYPFAQDMKLLALWKKIEQIFHEKQWTILSPPGDGKCLLYSIFESLDIQYPDLLDYLTDRFLVFAEINHARHEEELHFLTSKDKLIIIKNDDTREEVKDKLRILLNDDNLSELFIEVLSKSMDLNILLLTYDNKNTSTPYFMNYYDSKAMDPKYLILLNTEGHYMSIFPARYPEMKETKIQEIMGKNLWE
jgi:hypothetical protein